MKNTNSVATTSTKGSFKLKARAAKGAAVQPVVVAKGAKKGAKSEDAPAEKSAGINTGRNSGMRVMTYQDHTFAINDQKGRQLTNEELAADWRGEFPQSRAVLAGRITAEMVQAVRNLYNNGTGGHGTPGTKFESRPYIVVDGKRVASAAPARGKKAAQIAAPVVKAKGAAKRAPVKVVGVKKLKKVA